MSHGRLVRLDQPHAASQDVVGSPADTTRTVTARLGDAIVGVASVSPQMPPGPPLRGVYRVHGVTVRAPAHG